MTNKTGGSAFPRPATELHGTDEGMTLRDYFAAQYMQAAKSNPNCDYDWDGLADESYIMADEMLRAREK